MTMETRKEIFDEFKAAYWSGSRAEKGEILDHVCAVMQLHRKAAIRRFAALQMRDPLREDGRGRSAYYTPDVTAALKDIWEAGDEVCGELLHPQIAEYVAILRRDHLWAHPDLTTRKLLTMSEATVKRRVGCFLKARRTKHGITTTRPSHIKHLVPIFIGPWKDKPPGFGQIDTVLHSSSASGDAVYTVNFTDAATLAVVPYAQWNKGQETTRESMWAIRERMPFPLLGAHPDTGSEFINRMVMDWCREEHIDLSRSRPNHKNDNMYVEERNGHVIRKTVGYITLDCREAVDALNRVYDVLAPYRFHFIAVRRMVEKEKLSSRYRRVYEQTPKTPYRRTLEHPAVSEEIKTKLRAVHET
ncbi:MAG: hypothetical protein Q7S84_03260, partial [bacterium]|nr:hypothetical protein [bacterium]